jgi:hypothetical protein
MNPWKSLLEWCPLPGQRGLVIGLSGGGKSFLSKHMLRAMQTQERQLIIDPKREWNDIPGAVYFQRSSEFKKLVTRSKGNGIFVFQPHETLFSDRATYDDLFYQAFTMGNITIYIDEITAFTTATSYPHYLKICYHIGRSKGIRMLTCTQRPSNVPPYIISESNRFYIFPLQLPDDIKKIKAFVKGYNPDGYDEEFSFYAYDSTKPGSVAVIKRLRTGEQVNQ